MGFTCGIVGLPNVGKSTLFNAITAAGAESSNYPFCTIDPNVGTVSVPDRRLATLAALLHPAKTVPTTIEFVDIAGLVKGASQGEGLGNQFLGHIRDVDAIAHVIRCFRNPDVVHVSGTIDARRDLEIVETELLLKDLETVERKLAEAQKHAKSGEKKVKEEADFYARLREHLLSGRLARYLVCSAPEETLWAREAHLLSGKPVMYVCNVDEDDLEGRSDQVAVVREIAAKEGATVLTLSAEIEAEVAELPQEERAEFLKGLGLKESGLERVIRGGYELLHLLTFFTANAREAHAWTVSRGTTAFEAAGMIHTDFQRGFIRAEVMKFEDLERLGSEHAVHHAGLLHSEGKEYRLQDGDIVLYRFNV
jgi:GTP-binding protein YchF